MPLLARMVLSSDMIQELYYNCMYFPKTLETALARNLALLENKSKQAMDRKIILSVHGLLVNQRVSKLTSSLGRMNQFKWTVLGLEK